MLPRATVVRIFAVARRFADQANHLGMLESAGRIFAAQGALQKDQANHLGMPKPVVRIFAAQGALPGPEPGHS